MNNAIDIGLGLVAVAIVIALAGARSRLIDVIGVYGAARNGGLESYVFSRTLEAYMEQQNENSVVFLTTDSDYYRYLEQSGKPASARPVR
ncbi:MAG: hypothetical protein KJZ83_06365 [Burkholderiaceae bacterium]|nr:hypothetical protein [Burkholderiaceae bacterium]